MATQSPISTISYNSEAFLREKLESWLASHLIQAYQYICHKGEDGDKDHIHLRIEPNRRLDPMDLSALLEEWTPGASKPLGVRTWRPSKEEDWTLYAVHDAVYLAMKYGGGEKGEKLPYSWQDIRAPETYDMETTYIRAKASMKHSSANMASRLKNGENPLNMVLAGENPYLVNQIMHALNGSDYGRLARENEDLKAELRAIYSALDELGLSVIQSENGLTIQ